MKFSSISLIAAALAVTADSAIALPRPHNDAYLKIWRSASLNRQTATLSAELGHIQELKGDVSTQEWKDRSKTMEKRANTLTSMSRVYLDHVQTERNRKSGKMAEDMKFAQEKEYEANTHGNIAVAAILAHSTRVGKIQKISIHWHGYWLYPISAYM